tara:strand:+ start:550 stop:1173 length:624 start_codon:yes stop_codon:yes gene_type:complete
MATIKGWHAKVIADKVKRVFDDKGYAFFDNKKSWNVNIVGIRNSESKANRFDDIMLVVYRNGRKNWEVKTYQITTDPGLYWLKKPFYIAGTAILVPDQYRSTYKIDLHNGKYEALCQRLDKVKVYRDPNKDDILDHVKESIVEGKFGINIHKAGSNSTRVEKWSAGCQVFARSSEFNDFMKLINKSADLYGNSFTYSLITDVDMDYI